MTRIIAGIKDEVESSRFALPPTCCTGGSASSHVPHRFENVCHRIAPLLLTPPWDCPANSAPAYHTFFSFFLVYRRGLNDGFRHGQYEAVGADKLKPGKCRRMKGEGRKHTTASPCAACKLLRRRCTQVCVFAPHFPADEPEKFASVHKTSQCEISARVQEIAAQHRGDAVSSLVYEANARVRDPVYGCVGAITSLHCQIQVLQAQLAVARAKMVHLRTSNAAYLARFSHTAMATSSTSCTGSSFMSPAHKQLMEPDTTKSVFPLDLAMLDQSNLGEPPIWSSC
ncbi:hypothetical protein BHM03_00013247 [Ensete ventricosum]|nr:hypothetical protein BHM03_00013247 [Ensete ventricosum]